MATARLRPHRAATSAPSDDWDPLIEAVERGSIALRRQAARRLSSTHNMHVVREMIRLLRNENYLVRESAAQVLGSIGHWNAFPALARLAKDPHPRARCAALQAIAKFGTAKAETLLLAELRRESAGLRRLGNGKGAVKSYTPCPAAGACLASIAPERAISPLLKAVESPIWEVRSDALNQLGKIGAPTVFNDLAEMLSRFDYQTDYFILRTLLQLDFVRGWRLVHSLTREGREGTPQAASHILDDLRQWSELTGVRPSSATA